MAGDHVNGPRTSRYHRVFRNSRLIDTQARVISQNARLKIPMNEYHRSGAILTFYVLVTIRIADIE